MGRRIHHPQVKIPNDHHELVEIDFAIVVGVESIKHGAKAFAIGGHVGQPKLPETVAKRLKREHSVVSDLGRLSQARGRGECLELRSAQVTRAALDQPGSQSLDDRSRCRRRGHGWMLAHPGFSLVLGRFPCPRVGMAGFKAVALGATLEAKRDEDIGDNVAPVFRIQR